jgi:hypothetical protein
VIQFGDFGYGQLPHDINFREMTSVWMEIRSTPWIKDYQQYLPTYLKNLQQSFPLADPQGGYGQCIWMQFLASNFQDSIVKQVWFFYAMRLSDYLIAFDSILTAYGSGFCDEYSSFGRTLLLLQSFYKDDIHVPIDRKSLESLPVLVITSDTSLIADPASLMLFLRPSIGTSRSALVISRNTNYTVIPTLAVTYDTSFYWQTDVPGSYCGKEFPIPGIHVPVYPQPFVYTPGLNLLVNIYTSSGAYKPISCIIRIFNQNHQLIRHIDSVPTETGGSWFISWDGKDDNTLTVPTGIYYYNLLTDGVQSDGKIVVIRKE